MYINSLLEKVSRAKITREKKRGTYFAERFSHGNTNLQRRRVITEQDKNNILKITDKIDVKKILKIN